MRWVPVDIPAGEAKTDFDIVSEVFWIEDIECELPVREPAYIGRPAQSEILHIADKNARGLDRECSAVDCKPEDDRWCGNAFDHGFGIGEELEIRLLCSQWQDESIRHRSGAGGYSEIVTVHHSQIDFHRAPGRDGAERVGKRIGKKRFLDNS